MRPRLLLSLALLCASVLWLGATPPTLTAPTAVVFPLTVNGDADKESGSRLAVMIAQQLADNGVKVVPPPPGTARSAYLDSARKLGCDYYVTGFVTPLGAEVTVVEQVVSTISGTVIASNSAQLLTYADASGQGAILATSILRHNIRGLASLGEAPPAATPAPKESQNEANLSGLLKRKPKKPKVAASPAPSATPAVVVAAPVRRTAAPAATASPAVVAAGGAPAVVLFEFGGSATMDRRAYARNDLQARLAKAGEHVTVGAAVDPQEVIARASDLCTQTGAKVLVNGDLATRDGDLTLGPSTVAQFEVRALDCSGHTLFHDRFERDGTGRRNWERAIDNAVAAASAPLARAIR